MLVESKKEIEIIRREREEVNAQIRIIKQKKKKNKVFFSFPILHIFRSIRQHTQRGKTFVYHCYYHYYMDIKWRKKKVDRYTSYYYYYYYYHYFFKSPKKKKTKEKRQAASRTRNRDRCVVGGGGENYTRPHSISFQCVYDCKYDCVCVGCRPFSLSLYIKKKTMFYLWKIFVLIHLWHWHFCRRIPPHPVYSLVPLA